ncbi:MAG TPA: methylated-DNA--[protein]-cysteine S-methyltransferase [Nitrososphaerales archaeon]|nr:methylated-DNA--[protein]-cysteine S-methyltransferase [Nitrososphaerales archaeon]
MNVRESDFAEAAMRRDASFDGLFVFGVNSTGVYCRPSCPSKRPSPERLVFFSDPASAERAGFRACRRCKPRESGAGSEHLELVRRVCDYIQAESSGKITLAGLGARFGVSPYHLQRTFKGVVGVSPRRYIEEMRINDLKSRLRKGEPVVGALYKTGYNSQSWLYKNSTTKLGMTPGTYRRGGVGMRIRYLVGSSPLGRLLVAATEHGICAVSVGDSDKNLVGWLRREYPRAEIAESEEVRDLLEGVSKYYDGQLRGLPLDIRGTEFQLKVWAAIQTIPYGSTRSYSEVAGQIGRPSSARAVANACGDNPVPLIIPCHRVIRSDGSLGGYGLGVGRKRLLLAKEKLIAASKPQ